METHLRFTEYEQWSRIDLRHQIHSTKCPCKSGTYQHRPKSPWSRVGEQATRTFKVNRRVNYTLWISNKRLIAGYFSQPLHNLYAVRRSLRCPYRRLYAGRSDTRFLWLKASILPT